MLKTRHLVDLIMICAVVASLSFSIFNSQEMKQIVFIDNVSIFENFNMTKDSKGLAQKSIQIDSHKIDSLYIILNSDESIDKENIMKQIIFEEKKLKEFNEKFSVEETSKIWQRIKIYADDFSEEYGYDMILGAQPGMNIISAQQENNVTSEFLFYINKRYEGNK